MEVIWPKWSKLLNEHFVPIVKNRDRNLIMIGGRGSSKSVAAAKKLIFRCLSEKYFRYLLVRKHYNTIKNSQWQTIKDIINEMGLESLFSFSQTPLEIKCVNGNKFIAAGCDDTTKIKSVKDPSGAWYEEDIIEESDWITVTTTIRTSKADYLQEIWTVNPEVEGSYEDNWFWQRFFKDRAEKNFSGITEVELMIRGKKEKIQIGYTVHHSTYHHNKWLPDEFRAFLEGLKKTNPYYYNIYTLGEWGNKQTGGRAYKGFDRSKHLTPLQYNPKEPLHISFDFNVKPYMTLTVWQVYQIKRGDKTIKRAIQVDEIIGTEPNNNTERICGVFARKYHGHIAGLFVYGDPSGRKQDTRSEKGHNDFRIIVKALSEFQPRLKVADMAPPVVQRIGWINSILEAEAYDIEILINEKLTYTIMDYVYGKEDSDGTKFKEKFKDETGVQCERYHHISDANDYFLTFIFRSEFNLYLRGNREREYLAGESKSTFNRQAYGVFS